MIRDDVFVLKYMIIHLNIKTKIITPIQIYDKSYMLNLMKILVFLTTVINACFSTSFPSIAAETIPPA